MCAYNNASTSCPFANHSSGFWIGLSILWLFIASGLLHFAWNKVLVTMFPNKLPATKFWQALLLILTVISLCMPRHMMNRKGGHGYGKMMGGSSCMHKGGGKCDHAGGAAGCEKGKDCAGSCPHDQKCPKGECPEHCASAGKPGMMGKMGDHKNCPFEEAAKADKAKK